MHAGTDQNQPELLPGHKESLRIMPQVGRAIISATHDRLSTTHPIGSI
jgi:hypothetical protein